MPTSNSEFLVKNHGTLSFGTILKVQRSICSDRRKKRLVREKNSGPKVSTFVPQPLVQPLVSKVRSVTADSMG